MTIFPSLMFRLVRSLSMRWHLILRRWRAGPGVFAQRFVLANNTRVTLYSDDATFMPAYPLRESLQAHLHKHTVRVSLIAPVKNEAPNAPEWCASLARQTRLPDEIIVVDAGSRDNTLETLRTGLAQIHVPFRVIVEPGCNIARARNVAITHAQYPIIAATDFGCLPRSDWLERIVAPFESDPETRVVAGLYMPVDQQHRPIWRGFSIYPKAHRINPPDFVPSNRSIAFTKQVWAAVEGYPEWLTLTGEDTYFDHALQQDGGAWAFVPDAVVDWYAPENFIAYCRKVFAWAAGDGESGLHTSLYWRYALQLVAFFGGTLALLLLCVFVVTWQIAPVAVWLMSIVTVWCAGAFAAGRVTGLAIPILLPEAVLECARLAGFLRGSRQRNAALKRRLASVRGMFIVLSGVPIDDTGGGARCTQLALELLRQGFLVVFIHKFPKYESTSLDLKIGHPNLFHYALTEFDWKAFCRAEGQWLDDKLLAALVEFPLRDFLPTIREIRAHHGIVVYDLLDAWETSLGGSWYAPPAENEIIRASQVLIATSPVLVERLKKSTGRTVACLPNAVNHRLFDPHLRHPRPADLPVGEWTALYTGALWGEWFDWDLLVAIARKYPSANVVVIGDYHGQCTWAPPNLFFLGLKAHQELPAYVAHADVTIIPWKIGALTQATSPLKLYESLAMCKPVVAPDLEPLRDLPGVWLARDAAEFLARIDEARAAAFPAAEVERLIDAHNWQARVERLVALTEHARQDSSLSATGMTNARRKETSA